MKLNRIFLASVFGVLLIMNCPYCLEKSKSKALDIPEKNYGFLHLNFFEDGSISFQHSDKKEMTYISKENHPELLKELKSFFK